MPATTSTTSRSPSSTGATTTVLDDLADEPEINLDTLSTEAQAKAATEPAAKPAGAPIRVLALPAHDSSDALVLQLLGLLMEPTGIKLTAGEPGASPLEAAEQIAQEEPDVVLISHLPPDGLTATRYLTRRLRMRFPQLKIAVGRWDHDSASEAAVENLTKAGATVVFNSLKLAREYLVAQPKAAAGATREARSPAKV